MPEDLRFPIGPLTVEPALSDARRRECIEVIAATPERLVEAVRGLSDQQLDTPYRPGGWTVRQVVHHVPDSHMNAFIRFKLGLTEDTPTIKPYDQDRWAELADARLPPAPSLAIMAAVHERWVALLEALASTDFARTVQHPEMGALTLDALLALYAWHGRHHVAQITALREREGWTA